MRFKSEFTVPVVHENISPEYLPFKKKEYASDLGKTILQHFDYSKVDELSDDSQSTYRLDLTAFPSERWQKFKDTLRSYIEISNNLNGGHRMLDLIMIGKLINELDTYKDAK